MHYERKFSPNLSKIETRLSSAQLDRFVSPKSCYIQLDNLQKSGPPINSRIQNMKPLKMVRK